MRMMNHAVQTYGEHGGWQFTLVLLQVGIVMKRSLEFFHCGAMDICCLLCAVLL
jgi:hypothetical protein